MTGEGGQRADKHGQAQRSQLPPPRWACKRPRAFPGPSSPNRAPGAHTCPEICRKPRSAPPTGPGDRDTAAPPLNAQTSHREPAGLARCQLGPLQHGCCTDALDEWAGTPASAPPRTPGTSARTPGTSARSQQPRGAEAGISVRACALAPAICPRSPWQPVVASERVGYATGPEERLGTRLLTY